jgi:hypothetical protein
MSSDLRHIARRARSEQPLWASLMAVIEDHEGVSTADLAQRLGVPEQEMPRLALCRRPRPHDEAGDLARTASFIGANAGELAKMYRLGQAIEALAASEPTALRKAARRHDDDDR